MGGDFTDNVGIANAFADNFASVCHDNILLFTMIGSD